MGRGSKPGPGTQASAGATPVRRKGPDDPGSSGEDLCGDRRTNTTRQSTTGSEARLFRKRAGKEARVCYLGHVLIDNRHGLLVGCLPDAGPRYR
jgi:hypothetical protein